MKTVILTAPAHWASYLINGDATGFDYSNTPTSRQGDEDLARAQAFEASCGGHVVDVGEASFGACWVNGTRIVGEIADYTILCDEAAPQAIDDEETKREPSQTMTDLVFGDES